LTTEALRQRLADGAQRIAVMPNQPTALLPLRCLPTASPFSAKLALVIGCGDRSGTGRIGAPSLRA
jgi:hypothetical protein